MRSHFSNRSTAFVESTKHIAQIAATSGAARHGVTMTRPRASPIRPKTTQAVRSPAQRLRGIQKLETWPGSIPSRRCRREGGFGMCSKRNASNPVGDDSLRRCIGHSSTAASPTSPEPPRLLDPAELLNEPLRRSGRRRSARHSFRPRAPVPAACLAASSRPLAACCTSRSIRALGRR